MRTPVSNCALSLARLLLSAAVAAFLGVASVGAEQPPTDLAAAGERFLAGDLRGARAAYLGLLADRPGAAIYYNLGRLDQELGAAPQAVLWYRRALLEAPQDPWARENLERLRADLGVPDPDSWQPVAVLRRLAPYSAWVAALGVWVAVGLRWLAGRPRGWVMAASVAVLVSGHFGIQGLERIAPVDAVLMADCNAGGRLLPAGSEVGLSRRDPQRVWTAGGSFVCEQDSAIPVRSEELPPEPAVQPEATPSGSVDQPQHGASPSDAGEPAPFV